MPCSIAKNKNNNNKKKPNKTRWFPLSSQSFVPYLSSDIVPATVSELLFPFPLHLSKAQFNSRHIHFIIIFFTFILKAFYGDFPGGPVAKTLYSQYRAPTFDP